MSKEEQENMAGNGKHQARSSPTGPRQKLSAAARRRSMLSGTNLLGENANTLIDSDINTFRPDKSFSFTATNELPYSKPPANVKRNYSETPHAQPTAFASFSDPAPNKKRKSLPPSTASANGRASAMAKKQRTDAAASRQPRPKTPVKRKRKTKGPPIQQRAIPRNFDECDETDKLLITLRDGGAEWEEIVGKWKALTGETKVGKSTLPNRYNRLKENFSVIREEDSARLIEAKREIEDAFESRKWAKVAAIIRKKGGDEYSPAVLQRQYKKLMLGVGARPPPGVHDPDFDGVEPMPASPDPRDAGRSGASTVDVSEEDEYEEEEYEGDDQYEDDGDEDDEVADEESDD